MTTERFEVKMKNSKVVVISIVLTLFSALSTFAQDDEARQASGLPSFIGNRPGAQPGLEASLSGSILVQGLDESAKAPQLTIALLANGTLVERQFIQNRGSFKFNNVPRVGGSLVVEVDHQEIARYQLGVMSPPPLQNRQDIVLTSIQISQAVKRRNEVISILNSYQRTGDNQKLFERALNSDKEKKTEMALKLFKQLLDGDPNDYVGWTELGTVYFTMERYGDSEVAYTKAIALKADFVPALINLGKLLLNQKKFDQSIDILEKAVALKPDSPDINHFLGESYLQAKKGSKAVIYLNKAIELAPIEKAEIHLRLATLYNAANLKDRAVSEYKQFLLKTPNYVEKAKIEKYISDNSPK